MAAPAGDVIEFDETFLRAWTQVPLDYRGRPVYTDHWGVDNRFLPTAAACRQGSSTRVTRGRA